MAARFGRAELVELLHAHGADPGARDAAGHGAATLAPQMAAQMAAHPALDWLAARGWAQSAGSKGDPMKAWFAATFLCQFAVAALAQAPATPAPAPAAAPRAAAPASGARTPPTPVAGKLSMAMFRCGGIGEDEQVRMKAEAPQHDLLVTFSTPSGAYVADVDIEILRAGKAVAQGPCRGPLMLVDAARGPYEIRARSGGKEQSKSVRIGPKPGQLSFVWPAS